jgi:hypothetical protein
MARLSKAAAARELGISRTTLYKLIRTGKLSVHPDGTIDPAELSRVVDPCTLLHVQYTPPMNTRGI